MRSNLAHKVTCSGIPADLVPKTWHLVEHYLQQGCDRGSNYTPDQLFRDCCDGLMQLWVAENGQKVIAALVTSIQTVGDRTQCSLLVAGGTDVDDWITFLPALKQWAKSEGCEEMRIYGRIGWARKLGFDVVHTEMKADL